MIMIDMCKIAVGCKMGCSRAAHERARRHQNGLDAPGPFERLACFGVAKPGPSGRGIGWLGSLCGDEPLDLVVVLVAGNLLDLLLGECHAHEQAIIAKLR